MKMINRILKIIFIIISLSYLLFTDINLTRIIKGKTNTLINKVQDLESTRDIQKINENRNFSFKSVQVQTNLNMNYYNRASDNSIFSSLSNLLDNIGKEVSYKKSCPTDKPDKPIIQKNDDNLVPNDNEEDEPEILNRPRPQDQINNNSTIGYPNINVTFNNIIIMNDDSKDKVNPPINNNTKPTGLVKRINEKPIIKVDDDTDDSVRPTGLVTRINEKPIIKVDDDTDDSVRSDYAERPSSDKNDDSTEIKIKMLIDEQIKTSKMIKQAIKHIEGCQSDCSKSKSEEISNYPISPSGNSQNVNKPPVSYPDPTESNDETPTTEQSLQEDSPGESGEIDNDNDPSGENNGMTDSSGGNIPNKIDTASSFPKGGKTPNKIFTASSFPTGGNIPYTNQSGQNIPNTNGQDQNNFIPNKLKAYLPNQQVGNNQNANIPAGYPDSASPNGSNNPNSNKTSGNIPNTKGQGRNNSNPNIPGANIPNPNKQGAKTKNPNKQVGKSPNPNKSVKTKPQNPNKPAKKDTPKVKNSPKITNKVKSPSDKKNKPQKEKSKKTDGKKKSQNQNKNKPNKLPNQQIPTNLQQQYPPQNYNNNNIPYYEISQAPIQQDETDDEDCSSPKKFSQPFNIENLMTCFTKDPDVQMKYWQSEIAYSDFKEHYLSSSTFCYICCENELKEENFLKCCKQRCDYINQGFKMLPECSNYFGFN